MEHIWDYLRGMATIQSIMMVVMTITGIIVVYIANKLDEINDKLEKTKHIDIS